MDGTDRRWQGARRWGDGVESTTGRWPPAGPCVSARGGRGSGADAPERSVPRLRRPRTSRAPLATVSDLRPRGVQRQFSRRSRHRPPRVDRAPSRALDGARPPVGLVLCRRVVPGTGRRPRAGVTPRPKWYAYGRDRRRPRTGPRTAVRGPGAHRLPGPSTDGRSTGRQTRSLGGFSARAPETDARECRPDPEGAAAPAGGGVLTRAAPVSQGSVTNGQTSVQESPSLP